MSNDQRYRTAARLLILAGLLTSTGCTRNYYYSGMPGCGPTQVLPGSVQYGSTMQYGNICDVPTKVDGGMSSAVSQPSENTAPILTSGKPPRVVISEPIGSGSRSRNLWRPSEPESSLATTKVEGGISDSTVR